MNECMNKNEEESSKRGKLAESKWQVRSRGGASRSGKDDNK